ncbi:MAG: DUF503 domain-containing protein [Candidatus Brocadiae bacterium]|nr:DUF503 domain-containing protein [Candidatus Brocadiia bacterium]
MVIGTLRVSAHIGGSHSLKEKRQVLRSLKDHVHNRFNVSIAEVEANDKWQVAELGVAVVSNDTQHALSVLREVESFVRRFPGIEGCSVETEVL